MLGDDLARVLLDPVVDRIDLDRVDQMVGEVDHHAQAGEEQHDRNTDGQPGIGLGPGTRLEADGEQARRTVDEGGDEHAKHDLRRPVTQKVAQQPWRELGRGQLQGHDGQAKHERDHSDDRAADGDQQGARVVGRALEGDRVEEGVRPDVDVRDGIAGADGDQRRGHSA